MQIKPIQKGGSVLLPVMFVVVLAAVVIGAASALTSEQTLLSSRSADIDAMQTAGEGVLDYAYAQWKVAMTDNSMAKASDISPLISGSNKPAVPARMELVSLTVNRVDATGNVTDSTDRLSDYRWVPTATYLATANLRTPGVGGNRSVTVRRNFIYNAVPPTKGMFFTDGDFELYKPAKMVIGGDVHTNKDAHLSTGTSSANLTFSSNARVTYVGSYDNGIPAGAANWSNSGTNYIPNYETGLSSQVKKVPEISGIGDGTAAEYSTTDTNPNNDGNRELIEPPVAGYDDPDHIADSRLYNSAGLVITITGPIDSAAKVTNSSNTYSGGNLSIKAQQGTPLSLAQATAIRAAITNATLTPVTTWVPKLVQVTTTTWVPNLVTVTSQVWVTSGYYTGSGRTLKWVDTSHYETKTETVDKGSNVTKTETVDQGSYVTNNVLIQNTLYDKRELQNVPITNVDIGAITPVLNTINATEEKFNGTIYVYDTGSGDKNAVRVTNGGTLPKYGLTVATEGGLYVQGDYNTGTILGKSNLVPSNSSPSSTAATTVSGYETKSSALIGDSITVLSNGWSDSNASSAVASRNALNTTLNTALIGGYVTSVSSGDNGRSGYSGGMNNFPRLLETWTGDSMTFSGAFVSLYQSKKFTGQWDTGDIYVPPTRYWSFDQMLLTRVLKGVRATSAFVRGPMTRI